MEDMWVFIWLSSMVGGFIDIWVFSCDVIKEWEKINIEVLKSYVGFDMWYYSMIEDLMRVDNMYELVIG